MSREKLEVSELPVKYSPMGAWATVGWSIVYAFPIIGFIYLCINALRTSNIARRNHARAYFCLLFIFIVILGIIVGILYLTGFFEMLPELIAEIQAYIDSMMQM